MLILTFIVGAIIGSFLSVCIYRIPYSPSVGLYLNADGQELEPNPDGSRPDDAVEMGVSSPARSFCPHCKAQLRWWHNIPLLSWIILRGKCSSCDARISARYPVVELLSAAAACMSFLYFGATLTAVLVYLICAAFIVISFIDYDFYIIPNIITYPGVIIGLLFAGLNQFYPVLDRPFVNSLTEAGLGVLAGAGFLWLVAEIYLRLRKKEGLGMGDVKLLAVTGVFFGVPGALFTIFVGSLVGTLLGTIFILLSRKGLAHPLPFGPYLAIGNIIYIFLSVHPNAFLIPGLFPFGDL